MTKRLLADVLWEAANEHLWDGTGFKKGCEYSCFAVEEADDREIGPARAEYERITGVPYFFETWMVDFFQRPPSATERQAIRYTLLLLAMHVAEDEGIEV